MAEPAVQPYFRYDAWLGASEANKLLILENYLTLLALSFADPHFYANYANMIKAADENSNARLDLLASQHADHLRKQRKMDQSRSNIEQAAKNMSTMKSEAAMKQAIANFKQTLR